MLRSLAGEDKADKADKDKADNEDDNDNDGDGNIRYSNVNIAQPKYRPFNDFQPHNKAIWTNKQI